MISHGLIILKAVSLTLRLIILPFFSDLHLSLLGFGEGQSKSQTGSLQQT
jgi:hypothetical protein